MTIYQGDQYAIPITIERNGITQTANDLQKLEVVLAGINKVYPGEVVYNSGTQKFLFPLSQEETLQLEEDSYDILVRPLFNDGSIRGWKKAGNITVIEMEGADAL